MYSIISITFDRFLSVVSYLVALDLTDVIIQFSDVLRQHPLCQITSLLMTFSDNVGEQQLCSYTNYCAVCSLPFCRNLLPDRGNDGKTTSKGGLAFNGIYFYGKPRTAKSGGSWL